MICIPNIDRLFQYRLCTTYGEIVTVKCWSVRIPDDHQIKSPKLHVAMVVGLEPRDDFGVAQIELANSLQARLQSLSAIILLLLYGFEYQN